MMLLLISGCASKYRKQNPMFSDSDYKDKQIDINIYRLTYISNGFSRMELTLRFWNKRAKELCCDLNVKATYKKQYIQRSTPITSGYTTTYN